MRVFDGVSYRDATPEEEAENERFEAQNNEPSAEQILSILIGDDAT